jgi:16S rRNA (guanine966-N2)-methyltransferase
MRVLTGMYKGRALRTVTDRSVRPATARVRQTIFDMLAHRAGFDGAKVLDLFAGSGSLGIECLSRGAAHVTFVESDPEAVRFLEQNVRTLKCEEKTEILPMDAMAYLRGHRAPFDIVFADPPYRFPDTPSLPDVVFSSNVISPQGFLLIEHTLDVRFSDGTLYRVTAEKRFGRTVVTFLRHHRHEPGAANQ